MGTTGLQRERGMTDRAFFEKEFPYMLGKHGRIVACASKPAGGEWNRVFYAAVTNHDDAPYMPGQTWALVVLMHTSRNPHAYPNFHYKEMSEASGPVQDNCPDRILDLLSPTEDRYAIDWRKRCRAHNAREAKARSLAPGQIIRFAKPLPFPDPYGEAQRFRYKREGRKSVLEAITDSGAFRFRARIPAWRALEFEIESNDPPFHKHDPCIAHKNEEKMRYITFVTLSDLPFERADEHSIRLIPRGHATAYGTLEFCRINLDELHADLLSGGRWANIQDTTPTLAAAIVDLLQSEQCTLIANATKKPLHRYFVSYFEDGRQADGVDTVRQRFAHLEGLTEMEFIDVCNTLREFTRKENHTGA